MGIGDLLHGKITVICSCGVETEKGLKHLLEKKYPKKCKKCGEFCSITFEGEEAEEGD